MSQRFDSFVLKDFQAAYLNPECRKTLPQRVYSAIETLKHCRACPRECDVNRYEGQTGFCKIARYPSISSAFAHHGEESCLRGYAGSGTIFFSQCNLRCVFCQNWDISQSDDTGAECTPEAIADAMLSLQSHGCHNINFVTPEHVVPQVIEAIALAVEAGLNIPIVYNTSAYDSLESLHLLDGLVDIYMPDFKLWSNKACARYLGAKDYGQRAREAIKEMHRQVGDLKFHPESIACRGLMIRHLVMPGLLDESKEIFEWLANEISPDTYINIMAQYRPANKVGTIATDDQGQQSTCFPEIDRCPTTQEITQAYQLASNAGLWRFDK